MSHHVQTRRVFRKSTLLPTSHSRKAVDEGIIGGLTRKQLSLIVLVVQNTMLVLMMRYSRITPSNGSLYIASTAVVMAELIKLVVCLVMLRRESHSWTECRSLLQKEILDHETFRLMIPSALYAIQNNLLYLALSNLEAATFQITYQLKILSTAIFSNVLLDRRLNTKQWFALGLLMMGVTLVQITTREQDTPVHDTQNPMLGLFAVLASCVSSGFAGCYFERMLKTSTTSMWVRNIQLGVSALLFSVVAMLANDYQAIRVGGMFQGYTGLTWIVIGNQALGGLLVAVVVKHADNILKNFATSVSIIMSSTISFYFFDFRPSLMFVLGAMLVTAATYFYSAADRRSPIKPH